MENDLHMHHTHFAIIIKHSPFACRHRNRDGETMLCMRCFHFAYFPMNTETIILHPINAKGKKNQCKKWQMQVQHNIEDSKIF